MLTQLPILPLATQYSTAALTNVYLKPMEIRRRPGTDRTAGKRYGVARVNRLVGTGNGYVAMYDVPEFGYNGPPHRLPTAPAKGGSATEGTAWASDATHWCNTTQLATAAATFQTDIPYAAFSAYNWLVRIDRAGEVTKTGTVLATVAGLNWLTGNGTEFLKELEIGDTVAVGTGSPSSPIERRIVTSVINDTAAMVDMPFTVDHGGEAISGADTRLLSYNGSASAAGSRDDFKVTDVGGFALITFGCSNKSGNKLPVGTVVQVVRSTPRAVSIYPGVHNVVLGEVAVVNLVGSATTGATTDTIDVTIEPVPS